MSGCGCGCSGGSADVVGVREGAISRPTFFEGQLLCEDDLEALADYVQQKNRLHNRYLVGDGVVCGLHVVCSARTGHVRVRAGYALDACGNDVVVPCDQDVDVTALVRNLPVDAPCADPCPPPVEGGSEPPASRTYELVLEYAEKPARLLAPYASEGVAAASGCAATRIREGYRFVVRCPAKTRGPADLAAALAECAALAEPLTRLRAAMGGESESDLRAAVRTALDDVLCRLDQHPGSRCGDRRELAAVRLSAEDSREALSAAAQVVLRIGRRAQVDCVCSAITPPCPPTDEQGVLLARVHVAGCEVVDVCAAVRHYAVTGTALRYWLPLDAVYSAVRAVCCADDEEPEPRVEQPVMALLRAASDSVSAAVAAAVGAPPGGTVPGGGVPGAPGAPLSDPSPEPDPQPEPDPPADPPATPTDPGVAGAATRATPKPRTRSRRSTLKADDG